MQEDLAKLPEWYADGEVDLWAISPAAVYYLENLNKTQGLNLPIPVWKDEFRYLSSRFAARDVLAKIIESNSEIDPDILPVFYSSIEEIENNIKPSADSSLYLLKSPFSSSGRGLLWIPEGKSARAERQIISGMLRRQKQVSLEKALDKQLDFSMHFDCRAENTVDFIGYSVFCTNSKGAYQKSILSNQKNLQTMITRMIKKDLLLQVQDKLTEIFKTMYSPYYQGKIGVDMLVYKNKTDYGLHPCVEINMRKTMGYVALRIFENHIDKNSQGEFVVDYFKNPAELLENHIEMQKKYPLQISGNRICSGYKNLCPVTETTNYRAYFVVSKTIITFAADNEA
jgi:hypothetical protein